MPNSSHANFTFSVRYDPATRRVLARWHGIVFEADLYAHYAELMATAEAHGNCRYWLLDMRERNWHTSGFRHWFGNEFVPLVHAALRQPVFIAYLIDPLHQVRVNDPSIQAIRYNCAPYDVYPFFFDNEAAAHSWLTNQQAHDEPPRAQPTGR